MMLLLIANINLCCRILLARLEYLRDTFQIKEGDFLTFDALVWFSVHYVFPATIIEFVD